MGGNDRQRRRHRLSEHIGNAVTVAAIDNQAGEGEDGGSGVNIAQFLLGDAALDLHGIG